MGLDKKSIIRQQNERKVRIQEAKAKKSGVTPYLNNHGMTPKQIHNTKSRVVTSRLQRPRIKEQPKFIPPRLSLNVIDLNNTSTLEYVTPSWFRTTEKADVSVIVPLYKSDGVIGDLINSWDLESNLKIELIFVDDCCPNNSKMKTIKAWIARQSHIKNKIGRIFYNTKNRGYGGSCNAGAAQATGDFLIFLNADTKVTPNWIAPMIDIFKDPNVGIVGNLQLKDGGKWHGHIDSAGSEWTWKGMCFTHIGRHSYNEEDIPEPFHPKTAPKDIMQVDEREMVTGCCFAIPSKLFKNLGGFNVNYRIGYWEDAELCMVVKEKGYKIMYQPNSVIYHKLGHTNSGGHVYQNYNTKFFKNKWVNSGRIDRLITNGRFSPPAIKSILLKRSGAFGDVLVASMVVPALKKMYPKSKITFCTQCREVLSHNKDIDFIINDSQIYESQYNLFYDLDMIYELRPYANILESFADAVGVKTEDCKGFINNEPISLPGKYIIIHPGKTSWVGRDWDEQKFEELSKRLSKEYYVVCVGKTSDKKIFCNLDLRGKTNIYQLAWVIKNCKFFVGIDSFPMHIAQIYDKPGVCFFGSIDPETRIYSKAMKGVKAKNLNCLGCHHRKPVPCTVTNVCETGKLDCINQVTVDQMLAAITEKIT